MPKKLPPEFKRDVVRVAGLGALSQAEVAADFTPSSRCGAGCARCTDQQKRGLAPIVIVGQLQKEGRLDWRTTLAKNAPTVDRVLAAW